MNEKTVRMPGGRRFTVILQREEVGKWCDKIVRVEIRPSDLPKELDQRIGGFDWPREVNPPQQNRE